LQNSDYVLCIGTRLAIPQIGYDLSELARTATIDVVDIDPIEATKLMPRVREAIVCDAGIFIDALASSLEEMNTPHIEAWIAQCNQYRRQFPWVDVEHDDIDGYMNSYRFMDRLNKCFKDDQIVVTDMGTALLSGHQVLKIKAGQRLMTSTGLGEMGFGLPGAIGASFALDRGEVVCLNCDGGMMLNLQELQTIAHHQLPIKIFIFNNNGYLMIKHTQRALFKSNNIGTDRASGVSCPDYDKIGRAFGFPTYQIRQWSECDTVLSEIMSQKGPLICEVFMHEDQLFSPKLSLAVGDDNSLISPPLEDLSPLISRNILEDAMLIGLHEKTKSLKPSSNKR
jgi:acetolactate synthase-1/2/3 large subunit